MVWDPITQRYKVEIDTLACRYHLTITSDNRWIALRCVTCQQMLLAATHMNLWDWLHKAREHEAEHHQDSSAEEGDFDAGCQRCTNCI